MSAPILSLRACVPDDTPFLYEVYAGTRQDELALVDWTPEFKTAFLQQQFDAQHRHYHAHYPDADFSIILLNAQPIGRLYVARLASEIRIVDIALLPALRGKGIGTKLLNDLMDEAARVNKPVRIHVEKFNPALRLYERLGFVRIGDVGVYWFMEWSALGQAETSKGENHV